MEKPVIFISHIHEEKEIAAAFKDLVQAAFLNMLDVFVSSDARSIEPGRKWLPEITKALKTCRVEIIVASPESVTRPWVNFEAGAGWTRDIPVIPLCHSGMLLSKLPAPLNELQAVTATAESELKMIFPVLANALGSSPPNVSFKQFINVVKAYEEASRQQKELTDKMPIAATDGLSAHEFATLVELGQQVPGESLSIYELKKEVQGAGYTAIAVSLGISMLQRKGLIERGWNQNQNGDEFVVVKVSDQGWGWLEAHAALLSLNKESIPQNETDPFKDDVPF